MARRLLLPDDLLTEGSIQPPQLNLQFRLRRRRNHRLALSVLHLRKKDEVIGKVVKSEDIPAATQLFTPIGS